MMNDERILKLIQSQLDELSGDKAGGSGHLSNISYGNPEILKKNEGLVCFKCEVWVQSEFEVVEEEDNENEFNPYHYWKEGIIKLNNDGTVQEFELE